MRKYRIASFLMIVHGGFMELGGAVCFICAMLLGQDKFDIGKYFSFKLPYFEENLYMMIFLGAIYGTARMIGAVGLLKNRLWGVVLSVINCTVTIILMMFLLPSGLIDGLLAYSALILILTQYFGEKEILSKG